MMYCEFAPDGPGRVIKYFTVSAATHEYKGWRHVIGSDDVWSCAVDGTRKWGYTTGYMNFVSGNFLTAQGETDSLYSVIGKVWPATLLFTDLYYLASSCWCTINLTNVGADHAEYGADEPAAGQMRNWTN